MPKHTGRKSRKAVAGTARHSEADAPPSRDIPVMQQDPFADVDEMLMSRATDSPSTDSRRAESAAPARGATLPPGKVVCPFCGSTNDRPAHDYDNAACPKCTMADTPATRQATRARLGPWFVRQTRNPAAPGMKFDTLMALVKRGQVTAQSVVRGPTTNQFWRFAAQVKGLSREFGVCYNCATPVERTATICPQCNRMQEPPANPDVLLENEPTAAAATAPVTAPTTPAAPVHREIKPSRPAAVDVEPALAPAGPALATAEPPAPARAGGAARREPQPAPRDPSTQQRDLLAPVRPRPAPVPRAAEDGILSARDLATAFQLDFAPASGRRAARFRRLALAAVLLAVSGGAIALMVNPAYRDHARLWLSDTTTTVRGLMTGRTPTTTPPAPHEREPAGPDTDGKLLAGPLSPTTQPSPAARLPLPPASGQPAPEPANDAARPAPQPAPQTQEASAQPAPQITIAPVPSPRTESATTQPPVQPPATQAKPSPDQPGVTKVAAAPVDARRAAEQALSLWRQALDAEARRDYTEAVEHYEAIKKLPTSAWPAGLEINLTYAKKRVK